jgi:hypothetical protein
VLDIRGNSDLTGGDVMSGERDLRESGLRCLLKWHTASASSSSLATATPRAPSSSSSALDPCASLWDSGSGRGEDDGEGVQTAVR